MNCNVVVIIACEELCKDFVHLGQLDYENGRKVDYVDFYICGAANKDNVAAFIKDLLDKNEFCDAMQDLFRKMLNLIENSIAEPIDENFKLFIARNMYQLDVHSSKCMPKLMSSDCYLVLPVSQAGSLSHSDRVMLSKIKKRVEDWKALFTEKCTGVNKDSSWHEILTNLEYHRFSKFDPFKDDSEGMQKLDVACNTLGTFSDEEKEFLRTLPGYFNTYLFCTVFDDDLDPVWTEFEDAKLYCLCRDTEADVPIREYTIVTDRQDLWGLELYIFLQTNFISCSRHGIIRYAGEPPAIEQKEESSADGPKNDDDLPF